MATINGVLGPLDSAELGFTLMHEHVAGASAGLWQAWPELFGGRESYTEYAAGQLRDARAAGVQTFVDVTAVATGTVTISRGGGAVFVSGRAAQRREHCRAAALGEDQLAESSGQRTHRPSLQWQADPPSAGILVAGFTFILCRSRPCGCRSHRRFRSISRRRWRWRRR